MRRPVVYVFGSFTAGLVSAHSVQTTWVVWFILLAGAVLGGGAVFLPGQRLRRQIGNEAKKASLVQSRLACMMLLLFVFAGGGLYFSIRDDVTSPLTSQEGETYVLEGYVKSVKPAASDTQKDKLIVQGEDRVLVSIKGNVPELWNLAGQKIRVSGVLSAPMGASNPHVFDYALYLKSSGIRMTMQAQAESIEVIEGKAHMLVNRIAAFKQSFWILLSDAVGADTAGVLFGMLFGDKTNMDPEIYGDFQKNGTAHILSVSGIHVGIIYACMEKLAGRGRRRNIAYNTAVILLLLLYATLAEFTPSVVRAAFMITVYIFSKMMLKRYDFTACTSFTAFVLLIYNPFYLYSTGFVLSYMAVFVLAVLLPAALRLCEMLFPKDRYGLGHVQKTPGQKAVDVFLPVAVIQMGMAPLTVYFFNYFSFSAFFVNVPVIFMAGFLLPLGFLLMGLSFLCPSLTFLFHFFAFVSDYPVRFMIILNHMTAKEGLGFIQIPSPGIKWIFLYYILLFFISSEAGLALYLSKKKGVYAKGTILLIAVLVLFSPEAKLDRGEIIFVDVGQGDCMHIRTPEGKNILIDGGGSLNKDWDVGRNILYPYLMKNGVGKIDLAVVTHMHEDHFGGLASLNQLMKVQNFLMFEGYRAGEKQTAEKLGIDEKQILYTKQGQIVRLGKDITMQILYPDWPANENRAAADENENSMVIALQYKGVNILNAGDLPEDGEQKLLALYGRQKEETGEHILKSDILKVSHHGSKTSSSTAFLEAVSPAAAVIQAGRKNSFGHPSREVMERLHAYKIITYRNDEQGAILVDIDRGSLKILDMKERKWKKIRL